MRPRQSAGLTIFWLYADTALAVPWEPQDPEARAIDGGRREPYSTHLRDSGGACRGIGTQYLRQANIFFAATACILVLFTLFHEEGRLYVKAISVSLTPASTAACSIQQEPF